MTTRPTLPLNLTKTSGTLIESFQNIADWTQSPAGCAVEDTTAIRSNPKSVKLSAVSNNPKITKTLSPTYINGGKCILVWMYLYGSVTHFQSLALYFSSTAMYLDDTDYILYSELTI